MLPHVKLAPLVLLLAGLAACDGGAPWADDEEPPTTAPVRADFGPTAAYDRRLLFMGPGEELPTAAVFDFQVLSDSTRLRRGARVRVVDGSEWDRVLDAGWEMQSMREPWRLVPHSPLHLTVNDAGELATLEVRDDGEVRLEPDGVIAEHSPDAGTQLVLRRGTLVVDEQSVPGILLDAQLARSVDPRFARAGARAGLADSAALSASPTASPGTEALLLDDDGFFMVIAGSAAGQLGWVHSAGQSHTRRGLRLEPTATETFAEAATEVPVSWRLLSPEGTVVGELTAEAADRSILPGPGDASTLGYVLVSGWVEDRSVRREVFGLVRHIG